MLWCVFLISHNQHSHKPQMLIINFCCRWREGGKEGEGEVGVKGGRKGGVMRLKGGRKEGERVVGVKRGR